MRNPEMSPNYIDSNARSRVPSPETTAGLRLKTEARNDEPVLVVAQQTPTPDPEKRRVARQNLANVSLCNNCQ